VEILDLARKHNNRGFCAQYAIVFLQACQSLGIHARYVELPGHFVVNVWSDDYNKWVLMDPTNDLHYERNGVPLGSRRICSAYWRNDLKGMMKVKSDGTKQQVTKADLIIYRMFSILLDANQLSSPVTVFVNGKTGKLCLAKNYQDYPLIGRDRLGYGSDFLGWKDPAAKETFTDRPGSDDPDDFRQVENQTLLVTARQDPNKGIIKMVLLAENSSTFDKFKIDIDGHGWQEMSYNKILWELKPGMNKISARIHTSFGWDGPVSEMTMYYKPKNFLFRSLSLGRKKTA
jgi:hypothetical protein